MCIRDRNCRYDSGKQDCSYRVFSLRPGKYLIRYYANDTSTGSFNKTGQMVYYVKKAITKAVIYLNGTPSNRTYEKGQIANITAVLFAMYNNNSWYRTDRYLLNKTVNISANFTGAYNTIATGNDSATNITDTCPLNVSNYNITSIFLGDENYTHISNTTFLFLRDTTPPNIYNNSAVNDSLLNKNEKVKMNVTINDTCGNISVVYFTLNYSFSFKNYTASRNLDEFYLVLPCNKSCYGYNYWNRTYAKDMHSNWAKNTSVNISWLCDPFAPLVFPITPENNSCIEGTIFVNASATDNITSVDKVMFRFENSTFLTSWQSINTTFDTTTLSDGSYKIRFYANDSANNTNTSTFILTIIDSTPPVIGNDAMINDTYVEYKEFVKMNVTVTDNIGVTGANFTLNRTTTTGSTLLNVSAYWNSSRNESYYDFECNGSTYGNYTWLSIYAWDCSYNYDRNLSINLSFECQPFRVIIISPENTTYFQRWVWVNVTTTANASTCNYSIDGSAYQPLTMLNATYFYRNVTGISKGEHKVTVRCNATFNYINYATQFFTIGDIEIVNITAPPQCSAFGYGETLKNVTVFIYPIGNINITLNITVSNSTWSFTNYTTLNLTSRNGVYSTVLINKKLVEGVYTIHAELTNYTLSFHDFDNRNNDRRRVLVDGWWDDNWKYRVPVATTDNNYSEHINSTINVTVNLNDSTDENSIRVIWLNDSYSEVEVPFNATLNSTKDGYILIAIPYLNINEESCAYIYYNINTSMQKPQINWSFGAVDTNITYELTNIHEKKVNLTTDKPCYICGEVVQLSGYLFIYDGVSHALYNHSVNLSLLNEDNETVFYAVLYTDKNGHFTVSWNSTGYTPGLYTANADASHLPFSYTGYNLTDSGNATHAVSINVTFRLIPLYISIIKSLYSEHTNITIENRDPYCSADLGIFDHVESNLSAYSFSRTPNYTNYIAGYYNGTVYYWEIKHVNASSNFSLSYQINKTDFYAFTKMMVVGADPTIGNR